MVTYYGHRSQLSYGEEATPGTKATTSAAQFGLTPSFDTPDEKITWHKFHNIGEGRDYGLKVEGKHVVEGTLNCALQSGVPLFYAMGQITETGTDVAAGGGSTLDGAVAADATVFDVVDATNYAADDYIEIGTDDTYPEIRKIASIATNEITVSKAVRHAKATGKACNEVTSPYTHTLSVGNTLKAITIEAALLEDTADVVRYYDGCYFDTTELSCEEEGHLKASFGIKGMKTEAVGSSPTTITTSDTLPYMFDEGAITCFGGTLATVKSFKVTTNNKLTAQWYLQATNPLYAAAVLMGNRECQIQMTAVPVSSDWITLLKTPGSATTFSAKFSRSATDYIDIQATDVHLAEGAHNIPEEGAVVVDMTLEAQTVVIETKDTVPYYLAV